MLKISDSITTIIKNQPFIAFGIKQGVFNLTKLAELLRPYIEAQTKKPVKSAAIIMALSRIQRKSNDEFRIKYDYSIDNLVLHTNLSTITYIKTQENQKRIKKFQTSYDQKKEAYLVIHQRPTEISIIIDKQYLQQIEKIMNQKPLYTKNELCSIGVRFNQSVLDTPGFFMYHISQISLQGINIYEIFSTYSELVFIVEQKDMTLVVETFSNLIENNGNNI